MTKKPSPIASSFMTWLETWRYYIQNLEITAGADLTDIDYQDILLKGNEIQLNALLGDPTFIDLLAKAYDKLGIKFGHTSAQFAVREFLMNACWICKPSLNRADSRRDNTKASPGDLKKEWLNLNRASIKLAKQIEALTTNHGADSQPYLEERLQAGNTVGYILKRKSSGQSTKPPLPIRRLSELLRCFADDVNEEAVLLDIAIDALRQKGGAQVGLHFAMDALANESVALSPAVPPQPNFALVNRAIATLLDPPQGFDPGTVRRRFKAAQRRKTPV